MTSEQPELCDMPEELIRMIAERTDIQSRSVLRKCTRDVRALVDDSEYFCKEIRVLLESDQKLSVGLFRGSQAIRIVYESKNGGCEVLKQIGEVEGEEPELKAFLPGKSHLAVATSDLMTLFMNQKLFIEELSFYNARPRTSRQFITVLHQKLSTLSHELQVEKFRMTSCFTERDIIAILQFCKPGTLKNLHLLVILETKMMLQIVKLEQWKRAKELKTLRLEPIEEFLHFKRIEFIAPDRFPTKIPFRDLKIFVEHIVAKADDSFVEIEGNIATCKQFADYIRKFKKLEKQEEGEERRLLKRLGDGSRIELVINSPSLRIYRIVDGQ